MNIGFDVDGVLTDIYTFSVMYGTRYFGKPPVNPDGGSVEELFGCTRAEAKRFWMRYMWRYLVREQPRTDAPDFVRMAKAAGNRIYIITSRAFCDKRMRGIFFRCLLRSWLRRNGIPYDTLCFCRDRSIAQDKLDYVRRHGVSLMFEDTVENISAIRQAARVVCFATTYNTCLAGDVPRMDSFTDAIAQRAFDFIG